MARKPRKPSEKVAPSKLSEALQFLTLITKPEGSPSETHILLVNNWAVGNNDIIAAGQQIDSDIYACPHANTLAEALLKCGQQFSIALIDQHRLALQSEKFRAIVPCLDPTLLHIGNIDPPIAPINDDFKKALEAVNVFSVENGQEVYLLSILMNGQSVFSTNGVMLLEYWHGIDLPPNIAIPNSFARALCKTPKKLAKFGFSHNSVTFYFEDESWLKTQLFAKEWPPLTDILNTPARLQPLPTGFFDALTAVAPFTADSYVHFDQDCLRSHASADVGASYSIAGIPKGPIFNAKWLKLCQPFMEQVDFQCEGNLRKMMLFQGGNVRGAIAGKS